MNRGGYPHEEFVADAANFIVDLARKALAERNEFRIALSVEYASPHLHGAGANSAGSPWEKMLITLAERCVPPDDEAKQFAWRVRPLSFRSGPDKSIMRMRGEINPQIAAQEYQDMSIF